MDAGERAAAADVDYKTNSNGRDNVDNDTSSTLWSDHSTSTCLDNLPINTAAFQTLPLAKNECF